MGPLFLELGIPPQVKSIPSRFPNSRCFLSYTTNLFNCLIYIYHGYVISVVCVCVCVYMNVFKYLDFMILKYIILDIKCLNYACSGCECNCNFRNDLLLIHVSCGVLSSESFSSSLWYVACYIGWQFVSSNRVRIELKLI